MQVRRRILVAATVLAAFAVGATTTAFQQSRGEPTALRPQPGRKDAKVSLPRGEVLLLEFLQRLADATGETVCLGGSEPPQATIDLPRALEALDAKVAKEILAKNGFDLSRETYREKEVHWVQRNIAPPPRRGRIVRPGEEAEEEPRADAASEGKTGGTSEGRAPGEEPAGTPASGPRLYQLEAGPGARYIVIVETSSRKEAEDALALLKARRGLR